MAKSKTKHYVLKQGQRMSYVEGGTPVNLVGDGKGTVELNDDQAAAFKGMLGDESDEQVEFEDRENEFGAGSQINQAAEEGMASNDDAATAAAVEEAKANAKDGEKGAAGNDDKPKEPVGGAVKK